MTDRESTEQLMDKGFELLEDCDYEEAITIGKRLKRMRHSSGFEILATAYHEDGKEKKAIRELEEGVSKAPDVWRLWQLLGNYYSDAERYSDAHSAYRRALGCQKTEQSSVHLNIAIALGREKKYTEALKHLDHITDYEDDDELRLRTWSSRLEFLNSLGRHKEVIQHAREVLKGVEHGVERPLAGIHAEYGHALLKETQDAEAALDEAWKRFSYTTTSGPRCGWCARSETLGLQTESTFASSFTDSGMSP